MYKNVKKILISSLNLKDFIFNLEFIGFPLLFFIKVGRFFSN